jgi:hypothetical protein
MDNLSISHDALQKAAEKVRQVQEALETAKSDLKQLLDNYDADLASIRELVAEPEPAPAAPAAGTEPAKPKRGRLAGQGFTVGSTMIGVTSTIKGCSSEEMAREQAKEKVETIAKKHSHTVTDEEWSELEKRIEEKIKEVFGEAEADQPVASTKKAKTAKG